MNKDQYQNIFKKARVLINQNSLINLRDYRKSGFYYGEFYHDFVILKTKVSMVSVRSDSCQCQTYGKYGACEHTMALRAEVGLSISWEDAYAELHDEENEKKIETYKVDALTQFMDSLQNHFLVSVSPEQLQPLKLYYQLDYAQKSGQTAFYLRLYVNNGKRNYLIKNIHEFLNKCYYT
ncbi:ATP-dependent helicase, partial [Enterococcus cecorum]|nr:ATP-dependent helicase [Enterococcus cecorum]MCJ0586234.1 ATP-dependent helicase [Enterococcus cecorum]